MLYFIEELMASYLPWLLPRNDYLALRAVSRLFELDYVALPVNTITLPGGIKLLSDFLITTRSSCGTRTKPSSSGFPLPRGALAEVGKVFDGFRHFDLVGDPVNDAEVLQLVNSSSDVTDIKRMFRHTDGRLVPVHYGLNEVFEYGTDMDLRDNNPGILTLENNLFVLGYMLVSGHILCGVGFCAKKDKYYHIDDADPDFEAAKTAGDIAIKLYTNRLRLHAITC